MGDDVLLKQDEVLKVGDRVKVVAHGKQGDFRLGKVESFMDGGSIMVRLARSDGKPGIRIEVGRNTILGKAE